MSDNNNHVELPTLLAYTTKITQTAKGARIAVSSSSNDRNESMQNAVDLYINTQKSLEAFGVKIAPIEIKGGESK